MSLRTALLVLAIVPGVALAALWAVTSGQTLLDFQRQAAQGLLAEQAGQPSNIVYYNLQEERRLSAQALARPDASRKALKQQRELTDEAIETFQSLSDVSADDAPTEVREAVGKAREAMEQLNAQRALVDGGDAEQQQVVYAYYTDLIAVDLKLFAALSHVDNGEVTTKSQPLVDLFWAKEMISRSDALLARGWPTDKLSTEDLQAVRQAIAGQDFQATTKVVPYLPAHERVKWEELVGSSAWKSKAKLEKQILRPLAADGSGFVELEADEKAWREAMDGVTPQLVELLELRTDAVVTSGKDSILSLLLKMVLTSVIGLIAVIAVVWTTWRLTRNLRRRITGLQERAEELEKALPDVVERLAQGEKIDAEAEARAIEAPGEGGDELTRLGSALNQARTSAIQAAVKQADQHRGFERLLQRIARRTQQLIGQQLKKLDELERKHEDPEVLDGLFDLDHLTARLRRYEENLVILAGGSPHRRWRKPVPLLDVMRSAQGEVQDYRRVVLDLDGSPWLSERAVGPVSHVLAELIENALSFSRPPSPVEVRAAKVSRGLAIEVEDRGLGMDEEQLAEANELMSRPPRMDVLAHSEDIRLGLYVIARLADQHGLRVEYRPSAFGGTRVVILVPDELTVAGPDSRPVGVPKPAAVPPVQEPAPAAPAAPGALPTRVQGKAMAGVTALADHAARTGRQTGPGEQDGHPPYSAPDSAPDSPYGTPDSAPDNPYATPDSAQDSPYGTPDSTQDSPYGTPETAYGAPGDAYGAPDRTAPAGDPYPGGTASPFASGDTLYTETDQPYGAGAGTAAYADTAQPYDGSPAGYPGADTPYGQEDGGYRGTGEQQTGAYGGAEQSYGAYGTEGRPYGTADGAYGGQEEPYMTAAGQYPVPGHTYPAADEGHRSDDRSYGSLTPAAAPGTRPYADVSGHEHGTPRPAPEAHLPALPPAAAHPAPSGEADAPVASPPSATPSGEPPLPRRVRQASLVDELRISPTARSTPPRPPAWDENPLLRPAPRRAGAAIGAFQRRSRAARATDEPSSEPGHPSPNLPTREERS
ncbi:nitrate- and nitrite sensing domain-containing protein [Streptomyces nitrosporeus]|uniref:nitrate- and nitrite sensing domain-containing protein n=1 Tax=Streptomyces nitrosporeus TaxID=28894 RepID=UPI003316FE47